MSPYISILIFRNDYIYSFFLYNIFINDVTVSQLIIMFIDLQL